MNNTRRKTISILLSISLLLSMANESIKNESYLYPEKFQLEKFEENNNKKRLLKK